MTLESTGGFTYEYLQKPGPRTLLVLHGSGGNEVEILRLGEALDTTASLIAPRGKVIEDGMNRFFKRTAPGVLDRADLKVRTEELKQFIVEMEGRHSVPTGSLIGAGYSNGANILLHLQCLYPEILRASILFRPTSVALADTPFVLTGQHIYIGAGSQDSMTPISRESCGPA